MEFSASDEHHSSTSDFIRLGPPSLAANPCLFEDSFISAPVLAESQSGMRMVDAPNSRRVLSIQATATCINRLTKLVEQHGPSLIYIAFSGHPPLEASRRLLQDALQILRTSRSQVPNPLFVGLADVEANWRDDFQRGMVMDGVGGFCREPALQFAKDYDAQLVDGASGSAHSSRSSGRSSRNPRR